MSVVIGVTDIEKYFNKFLFCVSLFPGIYSAIPLFFNKYGARAVGENCWLIRKEDESELAELIWIISMFYGPLWLAMIYNIILFHHVESFLRSEYKSSIFIEEIIHLKYYPLVLIICWIPGTVQHILDWFGYKWEWLIVMKIAFYMSIGWINSVIFFTNEPIRKKFLEMCCCCFQRGSTIEASTEIEF